LRVRGQVSLNTLSEGDVCELAALKFGVDTVPANLVSALFKKTQGHPLYVEEVPLRAPGPTPR
jgi:hypothetical protein